MSRLPLHAFIDEAGDRSWALVSSDHFVMSAVVIAEESLTTAATFLKQLRADLRRRSGDTLHWKNLKAHSDRLHAAISLGTRPWVQICSVAVCKRHLIVGEVVDNDRFYLDTFRLLLERLSWLACDEGRELQYNLAHVVRFKKEKLREYERALRQRRDCQIAWDSVDSRGGRIDQPSNMECLQLADIVASATFRAFEPDRHGNTELRYLVELGSRFYRRTGEPLTSYGLQLHPWSDSTKAVYPWVTTL